MFKNFLTRTAAIAVAICVYVMPLTASASGLMPQLTKVENTPISYAVGTPAKFLETVTSTYAVLPENVKTYMAEAGTKIYVTKQAETTTLPDHNTATKRTSGFTSVHQNDPSATYIVLISDGTRSDATLTLIHEAGHYVDAFCNSKTRDYASNTQEFIDLANEYADVLKQMSAVYSNAVLHTEDRKEIYAEAFVMYMCWPEKLAENAPEVYNYIAGTSAALASQQSK